MARPDVLRYPSPTTSRYLIFATALLSTGLFVGGWVHNQTVGQEWADTYLECRATYGVTAVDLTGGSYEAQQEVLACVQDVEWTRALVTLGGVGVVALLAGAILLVAPAVVRRRRRLTVVADQVPGAKDRFMALAQGVGVRRRVELAMGPVTQRDAFSFGRPGMSVVVLPPALVVRWRDRRLFDPVVCHELAHVRHRDVALAWLTRSFVVALVPLLVLPGFVGLASGELSSLPGYAWRAAVLGLVVVLVSAALLRSREHDADLRAARWCGGPSAMAAALGSTAAPRAGLRRSLLAHHPTPQARRQVLEDPVLAVSTGFLDGFTPGFLAGLSLPLLLAASSPVAAQLGDSNAAYVVAAAVLGPLLAGSVGLSAWRAALVRRVSGRANPVGALAAGTGLGLMIGEAASLQQWAAGLSDLHNPAWFLVIGATGAGAVLLSAALGELWADVAPRLAGVTTSWVVALVVNTALFSMVLWAAGLFVLAADNGGWVFARAGLLFNLTGWTVTSLVLGVASLSLVALVAGRGRVPGSAPRWLVEDDHEVQWARPRRLSPLVLLVCGLGAGLLAVCVIVAVRLVEGAASSDDETFARVLTSEWVAGCVAAACVVVLAVLFPDWGAAGGLVSGVVATIVVTAGFLTLHAVADGRFHADTISLFVVPSMGLGLYLAVAALPGAALLSRVVRRDHSVVVVVALVCASGVAVAGIALPARGFLVGERPASDPLAGAVEVEPASSEEVARRELRQYLQDVAPAINRAHTEIATSMQRLVEAETTDDDRVRRLRDEVATPLRQLLSQHDGYDAASSELDEAHGEALAALSIMVEEVRVIIAYVRHGQPELVDQLVALRAEEDGHWNEWVAALERLVDAGAT